MSNTFFEENFARYACVGDTIEARVSLAGWFTGLRMVAKIYQDDANNPPEVFLPSRNPSSPGYIGNVSESTFRRRKKHAESVVQAWKRGEWFYCGIAVQAFFDDEPLTGEFDHALWGIECNYPEYPWRGRPKGWYPNCYLRDMANELAYDCAREAVYELAARFENTD